MSDFLLHLSWREPWWLLMAFIPVLLAALAFIRQRSLQSYADKALLPWAVAERSSIAQSPLRALLYVAAWVLLAVALAGPRLPLEIDRTPASQPNQLHHMTLMVALDISPSMAATDIEPDRLTRARLELADLSRRTHGERLGLLVFSGRAGMLLPPTDDMKLFVNALAQARPELVDTPGTNLAAVLNLARKATNGMPHRAVLLVTDGDADSFIGQNGVAAHDAAQSLAREGIPLYVLGVGSRAGATIPLPDGGFVEKNGAQVVSRLDADALSQLARATNGRFALAQDGDADWSELYDHGIASLPGGTVAPERIRAWHELYGVPLVLALLSFLLCQYPLGKRSSALSIMAVLLVALWGVAPHRVWAASTEWDAWTSYQSGNFTQARKQYLQAGGYAGYFGAGAAAWKLREYPEASRDYSAAVMLARSSKARLDAIYNLGNALFAQADWQGAIDAYRSVLKQRSGDEAAIANLIMAEQQFAMQRLKHKDGVGSDLRGHHGMLLQGRANLDVDDDGIVQGLKSSQPGMQIDRARRDLTGAKTLGAGATESRAAIDARLLQSGLQKLQFLQAQPEVLLRNMLKQDSPDKPSGSGLDPW
jgi:Ca-activated chloride channel family protein